MTRWKVGDSANFTKVVTSEVVEQFAEVSGDDNPVHLDEAFAQGTMFKGRIAHGMLSASFISKVLGTICPGQGAIYLEQSLKFQRPVRIGDSVTATVTVLAYDCESGRMQLVTVCTNQHGKEVLTGQATVLYKAA